MSIQEDVYPCPCCGYLVFAEPPGSWDICPICFWEDDLSQLRFPSISGGANHVSLLEGQQNFFAFGACEQRVNPFVDPPGPEARREEGWRPIDLARDIIEEPLRGLDYGNSYPADSSHLYYWRPTYWRHSRSQS